MKAKLLRKLRKRFVIQERNKEYRVFDNSDKTRADYHYHWCTSIFEARKDRRDWIRIEARRYKKPKKIVQ
jgi:hypothetical protein